MEQLSSRPARGAPAAALWLAVILPTGLTLGLASPEAETAGKHALVVEGRGFAVSPPPAAISCASRSCPPWEASVADDGWTVVLRRRGGPLRNSAIRVRREPLVAGEDGKTSEQLVDRFFAGLQGEIRSGVDVLHGSERVAGGGSWTKVFSLRGSVTVSGCELHALRWKSQRQNATEPGRPRTYTTVEGYLYLLLPRAEGQDRSGYSFLLWEQYSSRFPPPRDVDAQVLWVIDDFIGRSEAVVP